MALSETESLASIRERLESLVEARLQGLSADEEREYHELVKREAVLIKEQRMVSPELEP